MVNACVHCANSSLDKRVKGLQVSSYLVMIVAVMLLFANMKNTTITITAYVICGVLIVLFQCGAVIEFNKTQRKQLNIYVSPEEINELKQARKSGNMMEYQKIKHHINMKNPHLRKVYWQALTVMSHCLNKPVAEINQAVRDAYNNKPHNLQEINKQLYEYDMKHPEDTLKQRLIKIAKKDNKDSRN